MRSEQRDFKDGVSTSIDDFVAAGKLRWGVVHHGRRLCHRGHITTGIATAAQLYAGLGQSLLHPPPGDSAAQRGHVRLFFSPGGAACPPWQSVYPTVEGEVPRLMGSPQHSALSWYRRYGFEPALEAGPADHAGLHLVFYAYLIESGVDPGILEEFERGHLAWISAFGSKMKMEARVEYFRALGEMLEESLRVEHGE